MPLPLPADHTPNYHVHPPPPRTTSRSNTAYEADNYTMDDMAARPAGAPTWSSTIAGHPCYSRDKDLVIPSFKAVLHYSQGPLLGAPPLRRDILLFFRGDVGKHRAPNYSRGVRQKLASLAKAKNWKEKYNVSIGGGGDVPGDYTNLLSRSIFCLVLPGDGFSARAADAILHGCLPVVIQVSAARVKRGWGWAHLPACLPACLTANGNGSDTLHRGSGCSQSSSNERDPRAAPLPCFSSP